MATSAVLAAKATTMVILFSFSIIMGSIPIQINKHFNWLTDDNSGKAKSPKVIKLLLGLGGGVLLCTTFLHMLPEVIEGVEILIEKKQLPCLYLPLAELLVCVGFFIMYLVEELVHIRLKQRQEEAAKKLRQDKAVDKEKEDDCEDNLVEITEGCALGHVHRGHSHGLGDVHTQIPAPATDSTYEMIMGSLKGLLIVLGLSVHELFEGLAIGLEGDASDVWYMFAAVSAHKFVIAFCIGVELVASKTNQCISFIYICTFAVVSPIGIGIGMLLIGGDHSTANGTLPVILQGIATGTLLYVVFFEILHHNRDGLHQYLAIFIGFFLMCGLQQAIPHNSSHGDDHEHHHEHDHD